MTLKEFRKLTKDLPEETTEILLPEHDMPGWRESITVVIAKMGHGHTGPYPNPKDDTGEWGIFFR